jgi:DNA invertase Pin-like site-specific DNA recombinase
MTLKAVIYARVSTSSQTVDNQLLELREAARRNGWLIVAELTDNGISGAKGRLQRPAFDSLLKKIARREIDLVMTWSIDRLGRSIQDLVALMAELEAKKIDLYSHQQAIDTRTPAGRMTFSVFAAIAQFEREIIRERINAGLARARSEGKKLGRPSNVNDSTKTAVKLLREKGASIHRIAKELRIGVGTTSRILKAVA